MRPTTKTIPNASIAFATAQPMVGASDAVPAAVPSAGITTRIGTAVMSWNTDIAVPSRPCCVCSSPCSVSWRLMTVVDDCANTAPTTNAATGGRPTSHAPTPITAVVSTTWPVPSANTWLRNARISGSE